jgi:signal peptidase I
VPWEIALFIAFSLMARYWHDRSAEEPVAAARGASLLASAIWIGAACVGATVLRTTVRAYRVEGASMLPTLAPGDFVGGLLHRTTPARPAHRGDVVVFSAKGLVARRDGSTANLALVKRVVGLPGDRVEMRDESPVINGWRVPSCDAGDYLYAPSDTNDRAVHGRLRVEFLDDATYLTVHSIGAPFVDSYLVQPGEVFVLGDDRGNSLDSRHFGAGHGRGVRSEVIESRVDRFLLGTHRSGETDFTRLFHPLDVLAIQLRLEGLETGSLEDGIARCLANRPSMTHAPPPLSTL